jgi:N-acetyl-gamma-glutamyl-phosphate reductase
LFDKLIRVNLRFFNFWEGFVHKIFIDGSAGTTGLQLRERLAIFADKLEILEIPDALRKDDTAKLALMSEAELVFLCLPDDAAKETVKLLGGASAKIIDTSTAHRVADEWVYGFPELNAGQSERISTARYVANPGCHATGAIALLAPLTAARIIPEDYPISITSVTGYTGGGKQRIEEYETSDRAERWDLNAPRAYALGGEHKHLPEIVKYAGLSKAPAFVPIIADYPQGMQVIIPLNLPGRRRVIFEILRGHYDGCSGIDVLDSSDAYEPSNVNADTDKLTLRVLGNDDITILTAQFNNLGKGAAGAAIQNMRLMLGIE